MSPLQSALQSQYSATLGMLENAISACPDDVWEEEQEGHWPFWYMAFHTLFFLDHYLADTDADFAPPAPFGLTELDPSGAMPERTYAREELLRYLEHSRRRAFEVIAALTDARAAEVTAFRRRAMPRAELLIYNLRHVQHHVAQLNLTLRRRTGTAPAWVAWDPVEPVEPRSARR